MITIGRTKYILLIQKFENSYKCTDEEAIGFKSFNDAYYALVRDFEKCDAERDKIGSVISVPKTYDPKFELAKCKLPNEYYVYRESIIAIGGYSNGPKKTSSVS